MAGGRRGAYQRKFWGEFSSESLENLSSLDVTVGLEFLVELQGFHECSFDGLLGLEW